MTKPATPGAISRVASTIQQQVPPRVPSTFASKVGPFLGAMLMIVVPLLGLVALTSGGGAAQNEGKTTPTVNIVKATLEQRDSSPMHNPQPVTAGSGFTYGGLT